MNGSRSVCLKDMQVVFIHNDECQKGKKCEQLHKQNKMLKVYSSSFQIARFPLFHLKGKLHFFKVTASKKY